VIPQGTEDLSGKSFLIWVVSSSRVKSSMKRGWVCGLALNACACTEAWREKISFASFSVVCGKFAVEEVVTQGESVAVPVQRVEGSKSAFPDLGISGCVGASFRWYRILSVIVFVFSEIIAHTRFCSAGTPSSP